MRIPLYLVSILGILFLVGRATVVERKAGYYVTKEAAHYLVYCADGSLAISVSPRAGPYNKNSNTSDASFINHDFSSSSSYGVRLGFTLAPKSGTGIGLLTEEDMAAMKCTDGTPKYFDAQHLGSANGWEILFYAYHNFYEFEGKKLQMNGQTLLAMKRVGRYVAHVEQYVFYDDVGKETAEADMMAMLEDYNIIQNKANQSSQPPQAAGPRG